MTGASNYRRALATLGFFTLAGSDFWRFLLSWWGWGAIVLVLLVLGVIELVRERPRRIGIPFSLAVLLALMLVSIFWSQYPSATAAGIAATAVTTTFAVFLAVCLSWEELLDALAAASRWLLGLSLVFELIASATGRFLPFFTDYSSLTKIPAAYYWSQGLLFHGGRIQGIVGNANILAMIAVVGLIAFVVRATAGRGSRLWNGIWIAVAVGVLALTRSSTVLVAAAVVAVVAAFLVVLHRTRGRARTFTYLGGVIVAVLGVGGGGLLRGQLFELLGKSPDLTHRADIWATVLGLSAQHPGFGWGWVSYWAPWVEPFTNLVVIRGVHYYQAHDAWLDMLFQLGVVGLVLLALVALGALVRSWLLAVGDGTEVRWPVSLLPVLLLVALLVQSIAESRLIIEIGWALLVLIAVKTTSHGREVGGPRWSL